MAPEPSFLCTFCWTRQLRPARSKLVGREARIACETCWKRVLDLSICWVCGEIVVRGEEVVSLGWCFWHRACFGCLICGTGLDPPMENVCEAEELHCLGEDESKKPFEEGNDRHRSHIGDACRDPMRRRRGVELVRAPLCSWCEDATAGLYHAQILEIGLRNVTETDGGLSRSRLEMLKKLRPKDTASDRQKTGDSPMGQRQIPNRVYDLGTRSNRATGVGNLGIGEDGSEDGGSNERITTEPTSSTPSLMYVSVLNAISEPSFRAGRTKPLPRWMTLLPSNRRIAFERASFTKADPEAAMPQPNSPSRFDETPPASRGSSEATTTVADVSSSVQMNITKTNAKDINSGLKTEEVTTFEPILKGTELGVPDHRSFSDCLPPYPRRSGTPYPLKQDVCRPRLNSSSSKSSLPGPVAATMMRTRQTSNNTSFAPTLSSQIATPILSRDEQMKKRDISEEEMLAVEMFKNRKTDRARLQSWKVNASSKNAYQDVPGSVERRDSLRRDLLSLLHGR